MSDSLRGSQLGTSQSRALWLVFVGLLTLAMFAGACSGPSADSEKSSGADTKSSKHVKALLAKHGVDGLHFTNVAARAGLTEVQSDESIAKTESLTSGAAVADVNGDGFDDIFLTRAGRSNLLYLNNGDGTFTESARQAGVSGPSVSYGSSAAAFFDIDGDGDLDLFVSGFGLGTNILYVNDGTGHFTDQTESRGVFMALPPETQTAHIHGVSVGDVNNDGHLDLLVLQWYTAMYSQPVVDQMLALAKTRGDNTGHSVRPCESSRIAAKAGYPTDPSQNPPLSALYINDGTGHFTDRTAAYGLDLNHIVAFTGVFHDVDDDGLLDLAITGDGCTSRLFRNVDGSKFTDITKSAGVGTDENGMGSVIRDFDGDGSPDWLISSIAFNTKGEKCPRGGAIFGCSGNRLYLNDGKAQFRDATDQFGLRDGGWGWGIAAEDFANTGRTQIAMTNGYDIGQPSNPKDDADGGYMDAFPADRTRFWAWDESEEKYADIAEAVGIKDTGLGHAMIPFDMDNDGDLDLLIAQAGARPILYRNDTPRDRGWLTIRLDDPSRSGNRTAEGARVEVTPDKGSKVIVGWIGSGGSYESQKPAEMHLGFGKRKARIAKIEVFWPGERKAETFLDVESNQRVTLTRGHGSHT